MTKTQKPVLTVDISRDRHCHKLFAKRLWEALFRHVGAERWRNLCWFLCDLDAWPRYLADGERKFWWEYDPVSGYTWNHLEFPYEEHCLLIQFDAEFRTITVTDASYVPED